MKISAFGESGRVRECERCILTAMGEPLYSHLIILPIPTTRDGVHICGTDTPLASLVDSAREGILVAGYSIPEDIRDAIASRGADVIDASLCEDFLAVNADITARGAIGHVLTESARDLTDMRIAIIGYGRIGSRLARYLLFLGANVTVLSCRESVCRELALSGVPAALTGECPLSDFDLIINTAPAPVISEADISSLGDGARVMDLASGRFLPSSSSVTKLASIPEAMYPVSAGRVYAEYIQRYL